MVLNNEKEADKGGLQTKFNSMLFGIPAIFDVLASIFQMIALTMVAASVFQMMRSVVIIITALLSCLFLKRKFFLHHLIGLLIIFFGILTVGLAVLVFKKDTSVFK